MLRTGSTRKLIFPITLPLMRTSRSPPSSYANYNNNNNNNNNSAISHYTRINLMVFIVADGRDVAPLIRQPPPPAPYFTHRVTRVDTRPTARTVHRCYRCKPKVKILINALKARTEGGREKEKKRERKREREYRIAALMVSANVTCQIMKPCFPSLRCRVARV